MEISHKSSNHGRLRDSIEEYESKNRLYTKLVLNHIDNSRQSFLFKYILVINIFLFQEQNNLITKLKVEKRLAVFQT